MAHKSPDEQREYNKKYYEKNRDQLLEKKRKRYCEDEEYRKRINSRAVDRQRNTRITVTRRKRSAKDPRIFKVSIDGTLVELKMYTLRQLAVALGKSIKTLRAWEERGIFPKALYRDTCGVSGNRLYPEFQFTLILEAYAKALRADGRHRIDTRVSATSFPRRLREIWDKYPKGVNPASL
jgi:hypothetical protein